MRFTTFSRLLTALAVIVLLVPNVVLAQNATTGAISGTVTDPSNAVVGSATVTLTNTETGASATATTSSAGAFNFPLLQPGAYKVTVKQQGFRTTEKSSP